MDFAEAKRIIASFERHEVAYVVVGSMAMAAQGIVRATRDMGIFVAPDEANVGRLRAALRDLFEEGHRPAAGPAGRQRAQRWARRGACR